MSFSTIFWDVILGWYYDILEWKFRKQTSYWFFSQLKIVIKFHPKYHNIIPKYRTKGHELTLCQFFHKFTRNVSSLIFTKWLPLWCHQWQPMECEFKRFCTKSRPESPGILTIFLEIFSRHLSLVKILETVKIVNILSCVRLRKDASLVTRTWWKIWHYLSF